MKRRNFIKNSLLGSLALTVLPSNLLWASADQRLMVFEMPAAVTHIRHGLFDYQPSALLKKNCDWMGQFQKDVFLKYGLNEKDNGLIHLSLTIEERLLNVALEDKTVFVSTEDETWEASLEAGSANFVEIFEGYSLKIINLPPDLPIQYKMEGEELFVTPITGNFVFEGKEIANENGIYVKDKKSLDVMGCAVVLCIEK